MILFVKIFAFYLISIIFVLLSAYINDTDDLNNDLGFEFSVWGPGIYPHISLPVQYFYIRYYSTHQPKKSFKIENLKVIVSDSTGTLYNEITNRYDDSFIVRYQLFRSSDFIKIAVLYNNYHIAKSPFLINGFKNAEDCYCPLNSLSSFKEVYNCSKQIPRQIKNDFQMFKVINMSKLRTKIIAKFNYPNMYSLCHYVIKDNKVYRRTFGQHVGFKIFSDEMLLSLTRKVKLPNMEFFINLGDWPLSSNKDEALPIISWCGSRDTHDLILPTYELMHSTLRATARSGMDILSAQGNRFVPWNNKSNLAFFRGRDSSKERLELVRLSVKMETVIDARLTHMFFFNHSKDLGEVVKSVPFQNFFQHKYQLSMDGTVAAYRLAYLLSSNSLVLKQDSKYYEHYYDWLHPNVHYLPFKKDLSDLLDRLQWSKDHVDEIQQIILNANKLIDDHLSPVELFCYHVNFFQEYASRLVSPVEVLENMELVEQPSHACQCNVNYIKNNEREDL